MLKLIIIFDQSLKLSNSERRTTTFGEISNLIAIDSQQFIELCKYVNLVWSGPMQIIICTYMLWQYLGIASIAGKLKLFLH